MTAAIAIARVGYRQVLGVKRVIGLGLLGALPAIAYFLATTSSTQPSAYRTFVEIATALLLFQVIPVITLVIASSSLGDERRHDTLSFIVLRPLPRTAIVAAKLVAAWLAAFTVSGIGALLMAIALGLNAGEWGQVFPLLAGAAVTTLGYTAIFLPLGYLTRRATLIGLVYIFIWEAGIVTALSGMSSTSISRIGISAFFGLAGDAPLESVDGSLGNIVAGAGGAAAKVTVLGALAVLFCARLLRRRDVL
jgi:ABC-2 type transport system permease protein